MRVEAQRNHNGAVLRQQVFFFDPNYDNMASLLPAAISAQANALNAGNPLALNPNLNNMDVGLGGLGSGMTDSVFAGYPGKTRASGGQPIPLMTGKSPTAAAAAASAAYMQQFHPLSQPSTTSAAYGAPNNMAVFTAATANGMGPGVGQGVGGPKQEELLKQLFPTWF